MNIDTGSSKPRKILAKLLCNTLAIPGIGFLRYMSIFQGHLLIYIFTYLLFFHRGIYSQRKEFKSKAQFGKAMSAREAKRKSRKLSPFENMAVKRWRCTHTPYVVATDIQGKQILS